MKLFVEFFIIPVEIHEIFTYIDRNENFFEFFDIFDAELSKISNYLRNEVLQK